MQPKSSVTLPAVFSEDAFRYMMSVENANGQMACSAVIFKLAHEGRLNDIEAALSSGIVHPDQPGNLHVAISPLLANDSSSAQDLANRWIRSSGLDHEEGRSFILRAVLNMYEPEPGDQPGVLPAIARKLVEQGASMEYDVNRPDDYARIFEGRVKAMRHLAFEAIEAGKPESLRAVLSIAPDMIPLDIGAREGRSIFSSIMDKYPHRLNDDKASSRLNALLDVAFDVLDVRSPSMRRVISDEFVQIYAERGLFGVSTVPSEDFVIREEASKTTQAELRPIVEGVIDDEALREIWGIRMNANTMYDADAKYRGTMPEEMPFTQAICLYSNAPGHNPGRSEREVEVATIVGRMVDAGIDLNAPVDGRPNAKNFVETVVEFGSPSLLATVFDLGGRVTALSEKEATFFLAQTRNPEMKAILSAQEVKEMLDQRMKGTKKSSLRVN